MIGESWNSRAVTACIVVALVLETRLRLSLYLEELDHYGVIRSVNPFITLYITVCQVELFS